MAVIYMHIRNDTNHVFYIGIAQNRERAFNPDNRNQYWNNITKNNNYRVYVMRDNISWKKSLLLKEKLMKFYIMLYGLNNHKGTNDEILTIGVKEKEKLKRKRSVVAKLRWAKIFAKREYEANKI